MEKTSGISNKMLENPKCQEMILCRNKGLQKIIYN